MATQPRVTPIAGRYANKPGKFLVRSVMAVRELSDAELEKIPGFVRKTTEGIIFDTQSNAQKFVKSDLLKNVKAAAMESRAETSGIARQKKSRNPKLFNKIMQLAEEGKTSVGKIGTHPEVVKLNNGRPITYVNIQNIITREKGKEFFDEVAKTKQYYKSPNRISLEKNLNNLMKDYYKGTGTVKLTETYLPNSPDAKRGTSATVLEDVIKENIDSKKLANRPAIMGANQYGTRKEQIKVLKNLQNYLSKNTKKFTSKALAESNLKNLFKGSDAGSIGNFIARTNLLRKAYNSKNLPEGFKVNQKVKDLIKYLPAQDFVESELRALGFSEKTIKSMNEVETAVQKMTTASTQLEHALPRSVIRALNLPNKYHLMGERTTNFLNKFKMQFDGQMKNAAMAYAQSNQTPADYKKYITKVNQIRDKVRKLTGGYEMGWVDFDKAGNAIPKTNQMSFLRKGDAESVKAKGIENFKKNIQYHNALKKNFDKNPTSPDFFTLREEISESPRKFVEEFIQQVKATPGGCQAVVRRALGNKGGLFKDTCETIIKADPERAAVKLNNAITATKGPLKNLKDDSQKLIRLFRGEPFGKSSQANIIKDMAKRHGVSEAEAGKKLLQGQWFSSDPMVASGYTDKLGKLQSVDVTPREFLNFKKYVDRVNKTKGIAGGERFPVNTLDVLSIVPRYKLDEFEKANRLKTQRNIFKDLDIKSGYGERPPGVLTYDRVLGGFVDSANPDELVGQNQLKTWAEENPMKVEVGTELPKANKSVLKTVGRTLAKVGTPLPTALIDGYFINKQMDEGKSTAEIAKDPLNWLGLATMEPLTKLAGANTSGGLNAVLRLGLNPATIRGISRFAGLPGLAISTAMTAYDQYKKYQNEEGFVYNLFNKEGT